MSNPGSRKIVPRKNGVNPARMTPKQLLFVAAFMANNEMNAAQAAKAAGCKGVNAGQQMLSNPLVQAEIGKRLREIIDGKKLEREAVLAQLKTALFLDFRDVFNDDWTLKPPAEIPASVRQCVTEVVVETTYDEETGKPVSRTKLKFMSKDSALEKAMKHLALIVADPKLGDQYNTQINLGGYTPDNFLATVLREMEEVRAGNVIDSRTIEGRLDGEQSKT